MEARQMAPLGPVGRDYRSINELAAGLLSPDKVAHYKSVTVRIVGVMINSARVA